MSNDLKIPRLPLIIFVSNFKQMNWILLNSWVEIYQITPDSYWGNDTDSLTFLRCKWV